MNRSVVVKIMLEDAIVADINKLDFGFEVTMSRASDSVPWKASGAKGVLVQIRNKASGGLVDELEFPDVVVTMAPVAVECIKGAAYWVATNEPDELQRLANIEYEKTRRAESALLRGEYD